MNEPTMENLIKRLERLERQNSRFKRMGISALLVISSLAMMGQSLPVNQEITAQKFKLRDATGKSRAMLHSSPDGQVFLVLSDKDGGPRVTLAVAADGTPALGLNDMGGNPRIALSVATDGTPALDLMDKSGQTRAHLSTAKETPPAFSFTLKKVNPELCLSLILMVYRASDLRMRTNHLVS